MEAWFDAEPGSPAAQLSLFPGTLARVEVRACNASDVRALIVFGQRCEATVTPPPAGSGSGGAFRVSCTANLSLDALAGAGALGGELRTRALGVVVPAPWPATGNATVWLPDVLPPLAQFALEGIAPLGLVLATGGGGGNSAAFSVAAPLAGQFASSLLTLFPSGAPASSALVQQRLAVRLVPVNAAAVAAAGASSGAADAAAVFVRDLATAPASAPLGAMGYLNFTGTVGPFNRSATGAPQVSPAVACLVLSPS